MDKFRIVCDLGHPVTGARATKAPIIITYHTDFMSGRLFESKKRRKEKKKVYTYLK